METTSIPTLRPLRLGELLDQTMRLYRRNFLTFVGIIALVYIPYALIQIISTAAYAASMERMQIDPESILTSVPYWLSLLGILFSGILYFIFITGLGTAALTNAISRSYLGRKTGILDAYRQLGSSWFNLLITLLLFGLLSSVTFICPGLFVFMAVSVAPLIPAVVVIEKRSGFEPISRAWDLARRRFWWLLGFAVIFYLFNTLVVTGPTALISYLAAIVLGQGDSFQNANMISTLISSVAGSLLQLLILPIQLTAWTLVYFDLRVRTEGFDLALSTLEPSESAAVELSSLPTTAPTQKWLTGDDIGKFVVISLVVIGVYALVMALGLGAAFALSNLLGGS